MSKPLEITRSSAHSGLYARIQGKLGVARIRSGQDLVALIENGLPANTVDSLLRGGFSDSEIYRLIVPRRTLAHRIAKHESLSKDESDRAVRVARITSMAEQIFGDSERSWRWLRKSKRRFEGRTPLEMLTTEAGARLVEEMIYQLEHGMAA